MAGRAFHPLCGQTYLFQISGGLRKYLRGDYAPDLPVWISASTSKVRAR